jgi:hypothetical protein
MKIRPDPLPVSNNQRRQFCSKFDGYGDFCFGIFISSLFIIQSKRVAI